MTIAAAQLGIIGSAIAQPGKVNPAGPTPNTVYLKRR